MTWRARIKVVTVEVDVEADTVPRALELAVETFRESLLNDCRPDNIEVERVAEHDLSAQEGSNGGGQA